MRVDLTYHPLKQLINCGYCHQCTSRLIRVRLSDRKPDAYGEEYCATCESFPDYASHTGRGGCCPDYRMRTLQTRLRLIASPDVAQKLRAAMQAIRTSKQSV